jgi:hypothetical protein
MAWLAGSRGRTWSTAAEEAVAAEEAGVAAVVGVVGTAEAAAEEAVEVEVEEAGRIRSAGQSARCGR